MLLRYGIETGHQVHDKTESRTIEEIGRFVMGKSPPVVYMTGQQSIQLSKREIEILREYIIGKHGMIFADNGGSSQWHGQFFAMMDKVLAAGGPGTIFIKGANAVDAEGNAGVFCAHPGCGTIGFAYGYISGRGVKLIVPVGLEKMVASVKAACNQLGHDNLYYHTGQKIGMMPMMNAKVVTEITALKVLFDLDAVHVGGGGVTGSEGTVVLVATGTKAQIDAAIPVIESIKGEPPLQTMKNFCADCVPTTPAMAGTVKEQAGPAAKLTCIYAGKRENELPRGFIRRPETV